MAAKYKQKTRFFSDKQKKKMLAPAIQCGRFLEEKESSGSSEFGFGFSGVDFDYPPHKSTSQDIN